MHLQLLKAILMAVLTATRSSRQEVNRAPKVDTHKRTDSFYEEIRYSSMLTLTLMLVDCVLLRDIYCNDDPFKGNVNTLRI